MKSRNLALALSLGALLVVSVTALWLMRDDRARESAGTTAGLVTVAVERRTLVERLVVDGRLGFADARTVIHWGSGTGAARVTWLAPEGAVVRRGETLYRVDGRRVTLLYGAVPSYRTLRPGVRGADVHQLERNLLALGHGTRTMRVDRRYTSSTAAAVRRSGLGLAGVVTAERVVFLPGARRVGAHAVELGAVLRTGVGVMQVTSPRAAVEIELEASRQAHVRRGDPVRVRLPVGRTIQGRVAHVGAVARPQPDRAGAEPVIDVVVAVPELGRLMRLDAAPVTVALVRETRRDVLAVPITALLARPGGGYALQPVRGPGPVGVTVGMASGGYVEVSGPGIAEDMRVVAAA